MTNVKIDSRDLDAYSDKAFSILIKTGCAVCLIYSPLNYFYGDIPGAIVIGSVLIVVLGVWWYRSRGGNFDRALGVLAVATFAGVLFQAWRQGGLASPTTWWLIVVPFLFMSFGRYRAAMVCTAVNIVVVGVFLYFEYGKDFSPYVVVGPAFYASVMISLFFFLTIFIALVQTARKRAFEQLSAVSDQKSRLMANISHELRTPLNGVLGSIELLDIIVTEDREKELLHTLKRSGHHLIEIINDVLDFSKLESGKYDLQESAFDPVELLEGAVDLFRGVARTKRLRLTLRISKNMPAVIRADAKCVRQVICNLLSNAIKFTDAGSVEVTAATVAGTDEQPPRLIITVVDTGSGIAVDNLEDVYLPFGQIDTDLTRNAGGTGLGLTISKEISQLMGAALSATSEIGKGTQFVFEFPMQIVSAAGDEAGTPVNPVAESVVLIDPDPNSRQILTDMLSTLGVKHVEALAGFGMGAAAAYAEDVYFIVAAEVLPMHPRALQELSKNRTANVIVSAPTHVDPLRREDLPERTAILDLPCSRRRLRELLAPITANSGPQLPETSSLVSPVGLSILVVEDNEPNRRLAVAMLEQLGYRADTAANGEQAVASVSDHDYDLILMDCRMPVLDGLAATELIRAQEKEKGRPAARIVAMTGDALESDRARCLAAGMDEVIAKPFLLEDLKSALSALA